MKKFVLFLGFLLLFSCQQTKSSNSEDSYLKKARELSQKVLIADTHIDVPFRLWHKWADISQLTETGHFDFPRARRGGLDLVFMSIYIPASYQQSGGAQALADSLIDMVDSFAVRWPDKFVRVNSVADVRRNVGRGKIMLTMGMENGAGIEGKLKNLKHFYDRGIRYITLTHSKWNRICDSSYDPERHWHGLSPFGRQVVAEMNRLGIMVDVSHVSDETFYQVMQLSQAPVIASHSSCRYFTPGFERNMSDEMIKLLADKGGIIQISFGSYFTSGPFNKAAESARKDIDRYLEEHHLNRQDSAAATYIAEYKKTHPLDPGTVSMVADHIDHAVQLVGVDHVGLGSDFDGVSNLPRGLTDVSMYPNLIAELLKRHYSEEDIRKICGENLLRVWSRVEAVAHSLQQQ